MDSLFQKLSELKDKGIIADIDLEFCRFLQNVNPGVAGEVLLAACLTSYAYRQGDVCISLKAHAGQSLFEDSGLSAPDMEAWTEILANSSVTGNPGEFKPLILDTSYRLYLHKLWHYEQTLAKNILARAQAEKEAVDTDVLRKGIQRLFNEEKDGINWQQIAAIAAVCNKLTVISGGPGTGKTTTVVRVLALVLEQGRNQGSLPAIALAAPTGKAAARLEDSVLSSKEELDVDAEIKEAIPTEAVTIHQLLGARRNSAQFRYNAENPLPYDLVIIDEASMVDQALMSKLMEALLQDTRLILIGDKDQLASVEAGSVLGSICIWNENRISRNFAHQLKALSIEVPESIIEQEVRPLTDNIILLQKSYRFGEESGIPELAGLVNQGEAEEAVSLLESASREGIAFSEFSSFEDFDRRLRQTVLQYFRPVLICKEPEQMFERLKTFRILSPHRIGPLGTAYLNKRVEEILIKEGIVSRYETWYSGKPVIINQNEYALGLHNGDIGICFEPEEGEKRIWFQQDDGFKKISASRLPDYSPAFALTVHKSQGSEFDEVMLVLPDKVSKVMTRELLYTAITRARKSVSVLGKKEILKEGVKSQLQRSSGLKDLLWQKS